MSDEATAEALKKATELSEKLLTKMSTLADKYSQPAWELVSKVIQYEGIYNLVAFAVVGVLTLIWWANAHKRYKEAYDQMTSDGKFGFAIFAYGPAAVGFVTFLIGVLQFDTWLRVIDPRLYIARSIIEKVLN